jgi:hypothetical protein
MTSPFAAGPYATADHPSQPSGDAPPQLTRAAKIYLVWIAVALFALGCFSGAMFAPDGSKPEPRPNVPVCKPDDPDGTQVFACLYGDRILNYNNGDNWIDLQNKMTGDNSHAR